MSSAPLIELEDVAKTYVMGEVRVEALRSVSLTVDKGEFVALIGASGSGKSTLMNVLGCLDRPTRGCYRLAGVDATRVSDRERARLRNTRIGFVFQGFNLLARATALENVELPLMYRHVVGSERRHRARAALERVGLGDRMDHTPSRLSGGQQQRVAVARAIVSEPPLLLADEPTGNLDTRTGLGIMVLLRELQAASGTTIVLVTHEHDIAQFATRVLTMRDGRLVRDETQAPADPVRALEELEAAARAETESQAVTP
jgi:putative ABC transport system ATP-binding protein